jgi:sterol desaturase/sphingolipid hydroxylase (fatty acid hydroxylase superfamily)
MSKDKTEIRTGSIGFFGLLAIVFITLKLTGYITWSWWWVLAPLWAPLPVFLCIFAIIFLFAFAWAYVTDKKQYK